MLAFMACGGGNSDQTSVEEVIVICTDDCQKACCLGCKATEGDAKCIVLVNLKRYRNVFYLL